MDRHEAKYREMRRLGQLLHIPTIEAFLALEVFDKDGQPIWSHRQRSHSWVRNAYNSIFTQLAGKNADDATFGAGKLSGKNTAGAMVTGEGVLGIAENADGTAYGYRSSAGDDTFGILVGSGTNAESLEDFALQTKIANGVGAGQLSYVASDNHVITWTEATKTFKNELVRYFNNNSGGGVGINEVALVMKARRPVDGALIMMSRDKLSSTLTIPNTGQLKVTYTIQLTYPA